MKYRIEVTPGEPPPVAAPQISPNGSVFDSSVEVTLSTTTPHAEIYYTKDDSVVTTDSIPYEGPVTLTETTRVRARAFREGYSPSEERQATFLAAREAAPLAVTKLPDDTIDHSLRLWWRAGAGVPNSYGEQWLDQSGNGNDGNQSVGLSQPRLVLDAANGLPAMRFDGSDDAISFTSEIGNVRTVFWVLRSAETESTSSGYRSMLGDDSWTGWRGGYGHPGAMFGSSERHDKGRPSVGKRRTG